MDKNYVQGWSSMGLIVHETWKDIKGYAGAYQVSDLGRVKSFPREGTKGGVLTPTLTDKGYLRVQLYNNGAGKRFFVHVLVAGAFVPNHNNKPQVNHKDGIKVNNEAINLEWVTQFENIKHRDEVLGIHFRGDRGPKAKLSWDDVKSIRYLLKYSRYTQYDIAALYFITQSVVSKIKLNKIWKI